MFQISALTPYSECNNNKEKCSLVFQIIGIAQTTWCHNQEENNIFIHRSENLKAYNQM